MEIQNQMQELNPFTDADTEYQNGFHSQRHTIKTQQDMLTTAKLQLKNSMTPRDTMIGLNKKRSNSYGFLNFTKSPNYNHQNLIQEFDINIQKPHPVKRKPFIAPELIIQKESNPTTLPLFVRDQLDVNTDPRKNIKKPNTLFILSPKSTTGTQTAGNQQQKMQFYHLKSPSQILTPIHRVTSSQGFFQLTSNDANSLANKLEAYSGNQGQNFGSTPRQHFGQNIDELPPPNATMYPYVSPRKRQTMAEDRNMPKLMNDVMLSGGLQPDGVSPRTEFAVDHVIDKHHNQASVIEKKFVKETIDQKRKKGGHRAQLSLNITKQNNMKKGLNQTDRISQKAVLSDITGTLDKAVTQIKSERQVKRTKVTKLLKLKHVNLAMPAMKKVKEENQKLFKQSLGGSSMMFQKIT